MRGEKEVVGKVGVQASDNSRPVDAHPPMHLLDLSSLQQPWGHRIHYTLQQFQRGDVALRLEALERWCARALLGLVVLLDLTQTPHAALVRVRIPGAAAVALVERPASDAVCMLLEILVREGLQQL